MSQRVFGAAGLVLWLSAAPALAADAVADRPLAQDGASTVQANSGSEHRGRERADGGEGQGPREAVDAKNLFGFTLGSDILRQGRMEVEGEGVGRIGRRTSRYEAGEPSLRFQYGVTNNFSVAGALFGDYHSVLPFGGAAGLNAGADRLGGGGGGAATGEVITPVPSRMRFNGGDIRLRFGLLDRQTSPFGLTIQIQPSRRLYADDTGMAAESYLSEHRLILDAQITQNLFVAANLVHQIDATRPRGERTFDEASTLGATFAATNQVAPGLFLGGELQYLRAYAGLGLDRFLGEAVYVGPTLFAKLPREAFLTLSYNIQIAGRERDNPAARRDLTNFERHRFLIRTGVEF
ncbi:hypothetical protein ACRAWG_10075 [Methylobacterium sp. P31]